MTRYGNSFEGQTEGATATAANSGTSGTAFSAVTVTAGAALTYTWLAQHGNGMGLRAVYAAAATGFVDYAVAPASATTRVAVRAYLSWTDTASATARNEHLLALRTASANVAYVTLSSTGNFQLLDSAGTSIATSPAPTIGTQYRVEFAAAPGTTTANGSAAIAVYVGDSATPFWTASTSTANTGTAAITTVRIGRTSTADGARTVYFDDVAADDALASGWIGVATNFAVQASNAPPRIRLTIAAPDMSTITAVSVTRLDPTGGAYTRVQPSPGPSPLILDDYEAPWDTAVVYLVGVTYAGGAKSVTFNSGYLTISPSAAWAIHPTTPALSVCIDQGTFTAMGILSLGAVARPALTTKHRILGAEYQIVTRTGPRAAPSLSMQLATTSLAERTAIAALVRDQTPLLIQIPASWGWGWDNAYFDVGDVSEERLLQYGPEARRTVTLPLERVESPIGTQAAPWTWTGVATGSATWDAVKAAYATWSDVLTNTRK